VTATELRERSAAMEDWTPAQILAWAAYAGSRVAFGTGFGAEGCVLVHLIASSRLPVDIFTLDTGVLFPETYALWHALQDKYGIAIRAVRPQQTIEEQAASVGPALWERQPDECCRLRKVEPLREALKHVDVWITAIRRDQTPDRATAPVAELDDRYGLIKVNPLARWTTKDVWRFLHANSVPYNPLHDAGYPSIGCQPCTTPVAAGEDPRAGRWRGHQKNECGLHVEVHPVDLRIRVTPVP
jgi:thioredoxin-dependent adenylylsulfate APS reductase